MIKMDENCALLNNKAHLVLHLHDELLYEVPENGLNTFLTLLKCTLEGSVKLTIPFPVKIKYGMSWGEMTEKNL